VGGFNGVMQLKQSSDACTVSLLSEFNSAFGSYIVLGKSRGTNGLVSNGDTLGKIIFAGGDGTDVASSAASIHVEVDGTPGTDDMPGRLVFSTTADGAASPTERFRISSDGSFSSVIPGGSTLYPQFGCRAWVNFNGTTATPSTIRGSGNVSSVTKIAQGKYTINFASALTDANYAMCVTASADANGNVSFWTNYGNGQNTTQTSSACNVYVTNAGSSFIDSTWVNISVFR
jgi:hypothetical protein